MPDPLSPIQRVVMLRRIDPEQGMARFYSLTIERDLFGTVRFVRHWGRIGAMQGRELAQDFPTEGGRRGEGAAGSGQAAARIPGSRNRPRGR